MTKQTVIPRKGKRGPAPTGKGAPVVVRMQPPMLASLDEWIAAQPEPRPSRPEAVRRLVSDALNVAAPFQELLLQFFREDQRRIEAWSNEPGTTPEEAVAGFMDDNADDNPCAPAFRLLEVVDDETGPAADRLRAALRPIAVRPDPNSRKRRGAKR